MDGTEEWIEWRGLKSGGTEESRGLEGLRGRGRLTVCLVEELNQWNGVEDMVTITDRLREVDGLDIHLETILSPVLSS